MVKDTMQTTHLKDLALTFRECSVNLMFRVCYFGGSPIGFSESGIWLISRPGFGILKEKGDEIRDYNYDRDTAFGDFNRRESRNVGLKKPRFGNSRKSSCHLSSSEIAEQ